MREPVILLLLAATLAALSVSAHGAVLSGPLLVALGFGLIGALLLWRRRWYPL